MFLVAWWLVALCVCVGLVALICGFVHSRLLFDRYVRRLNPALYGRLTEGANVAVFTIFSTDRTAAMQRFREDVSTPTEDMILNRMRWTSWWLYRTFVGAWLVGMLVVVAYAVVVRVAGGR